MNTRIDPINKCIVICFDISAEELGYPDSLELFDIDITVDD